MSQWDHIPVGKLDTAVLFAVLVERFNGLLETRGQALAELSDAKAELDTASQLIGQVRGMIALGNTSLEIANVIDAWMFRKEPYA